jgi:hypothetical protein
MPYKKSNPIRKKYATVYANRSRKKLKEQAVQYMGGYCSKCGFNKNICALQFHHLDPAEKDFGISSDGVHRSWAKVKSELDKCIMVCANCHAEIHEEEYNKKCMIQEKELAELQKTHKSKNEIGSTITNCAQCNKPIKVFNSALRERNFCDRECRDLCLNNLGWCSDDELLDMRKTMTIKEIADKLGKDYKRVRLRLKIIPL